MFCEKEAESQDVDRGNMRIGMGVSADIIMI